MKLAKEKGWLQNNESKGRRLDFARSAPEFVFALFGEGKQRMCRSYELMFQHKGEITPQLMMSITRDHWPHSLQGESLCL